DAGRRQPGVGQRGADPAGDAGVGARVGGQGGETPAALVAAHRRADAAGHLGVGAGVVGEGAEALGSVLHGGRSSWRSRCSGWPEWGWSVCSPTIGAKGAAVERARSTRPLVPSGGGGCGSNRRVSTGRIVYTDGACSGNPGPGGWAWAVAPSGPFASGAEAQTTNQRMELRAVLEALAALDGPLEVRSDSTYVVNCFRDRWWEGWLARGWTNSQKKPVANRDLWEPLIQAYRRRTGEIAFTWVKGHSSDRLNDVVDRLAVEASLTQRPRAGDTLPGEDDLGPADVVVGGGVAAPADTGRSAATRPPAGRDGRLPGGRLVVAFGLRPPELGGYGE